MRFDLDIAYSPAGRLEGELAVAGADREPAPFGGTMELIAVLEDLIREGDVDRTPAS